MGAGGKRLTPLDEDDAVVYRIAESTGRPLAEVMEIGVDEMVGWLRYYMWKDARMEKTDAYLAQVAMICDLARGVKGSRKLTDYQIKYEAPRQATELVAMLQGLFGGGG